MPAGGLVTAGVIAAGTAIYSGIKAAKAKKAQEALKNARPKYEIQPEEQDIENMAEARANQGMGAGARQQLQNNTDRQLSTSANAILMGGGNANSIGNLADKTENAYDQSALYDDQVRLSNLSNLQSAWARMSANRDKQWDINTEQPWKDNMAAATLERQQYAQMEQNAIGSLGKDVGGALGKVNWGGGGGDDSGGNMSQLPTSGNKMMDTSHGGSTAPYFSIPSGPVGGGQDFGNMSGFMGNNGGGGGNASPQYPIGGNTNVGSSPYSYWGQ